MCAIIKARSRQKKTKERKKIVPNFAVVVFSQRRENCRFRDDASIDRSIDKTRGDLLDAINSLRRALSFFF